MAPEPRVCANCGVVLPPGADRCLTCGTPVDPRAAAMERPVARPRDEGNGAPGPNPDLVRRIARLKQWAEAAEPLEVTIPRLPAWTDDATRTGRDGDPWSGVLRGIERLAQQRVVQALEGWEKATKNRLVRLEAYSVDGRLERDQIDDVLRAARAGEISQALATFQQVDRVVALKERHIDQARDELERIVSLLRDMDALGIGAAHDAQEINDDLERELRGGRLAPLKQQLRALRLQAVARLKVGFPEYVGDYGKFLLEQRHDGTNVAPEVAELARAAKAFHRGNPEEALRRLRMLAQVHGAPSTRGARPRPRRDDAPATGAARTTGRPP